VVIWKRDSFAIATAREALRSGRTSTGTAAPAQGRTLPRGICTTRHLFKVSPWSLSAFLVALAVLAVAIGARLLFELLGATFYYATFFPAVLLASLIAGVPAGACAAVLTIPVVWWAFLPPPFEFNQLSPLDYGNLTVFLLCSTLLIWFAQLCREALIARERLSALQDF
jgi:K+-sensing histidine kinase KdpD